MQALQQRLMLRWQPLHLAPIPSWRLRLAGVCGLGTIFIVLDVLTDGYLRRFDHTVFMTMLTPQWQSWRWFFEPAHYIGQRWMVATPLVLVTALAIWRTRSWRPVVISGSTMVATALIVGAIKELFGRSSPSPVLDVLHFFHGSQGTAFPSGHATNTIVIPALVVRTLVGLYGDRIPLLATTKRRAAVVAAISLTGNIGIIGINYHWFTDVVAGLLIGVMIAIVSPNPVRGGFGDRVSAQELREDRADAQLEPTPARPQLPQAPVSPLAGPIGSVGAGDPKAPGS